jgi:hydrogenase expression/formation protein HypC
VCLAVPMRIVSIAGELATIEVGGLTQRTSLVLVPEATIGDFVLVHAGYAITVLDAEEAAERERLFAEFRQSAMYEAETGYAPGDAVNGGAESAGTVIGDDDSGGGGEPSSAESP